MLGIEIRQVQVAEDIDVVDEERCAVRCEQGACLTDASACVEKCGALIADAYCHTFDGMVGHVVDNLLAKVVYVDDYFGLSASCQFLKYMGKQWLAVCLHQCFGSGIGQRFQTGAKSCGKYKCFHSNVLCISCSRCVSSTVMPNLSCRW